MGIIISNKNQMQIDIQGVRKWFLSFLYVTFLTNSNHMKD
jgi:hypothetical protein